MKTKSMTYFWYRSVFDKPTFASGSAPKYLSLLKRTAYHAPPMEEVEMKPYMRSMLEYLVIE